MPRFPAAGRAANAMPESVFARLWPRLEGFAGEVFPFHLGDVHLPPAAGLGAGDRGVYAYGAPAGEPALLEALAEKLRRQNGLEGVVQVTCGATHAFACATRALLDPGDEVVLLAPHWPLIRGQILACLALPVECVGDVAAAVTERTAAIYVTTPGNPDGRVLGRAELEVIAEIARQRDLWVLSDEVYEDFTFDGRDHVSIGSLPGMAERTLTVFSFSKAYGLAGLRVGYLVGPGRIVDPIRKLSNHSVFNVPVCLQRTALEALRDGAGYLGSARAEYQAARDLVQARLRAAGIPFRPAEGAAYVFCDLSGFGEDALERLAARGVLLAPGEAFGASFRGWARLCTTAIEKARLIRGVDVLVEVLRGRTEGEV